MTLAVGKKDVQVMAAGKKVVERKVPLPTKWIKGLTTVQHYMSRSEERYTLHRIQAIQLFKTIPKGKIKSDYYLIKTGQSLVFFADENKKCPDHRRYPSTPFYYSHYYLC